LTWSNPLRGITLQLSRGESCVVFDQSFESLNSDDFDDRLPRRSRKSLAQLFDGFEERDSILDSLGITFEFAKKIRIGLSDRTLGPKYRGGGGRPDYSSDLDSWNSGSCAKVDMKSSGCAVVPIIMGGQVRSIYGRRLDRSRIELWASGLPGTLFEIVGSSDGTRRSLPIRCLAGFVLRVQSIVRTVKSLPSWYSLLEAQKASKSAPPKNWLNDSNT